jgi:hypothetical protein
VGSMAITGVDQILSAMSELILWIFFGVLMVQSVSYVFAVLPLTTPKIVAFTPAH